MRLLPPTPDSPPVITVTGSREYCDVLQVVTALDTWRVDLIKQYSIAPILHVGDCPTGADRIAAEHWIAQKYGTMDTYVANWPLYGKSAGPTRNYKMMQDGADIVLAFPILCDREECLNKAEHYSHGTKSTLAAARKFNLKTSIFCENFSDKYFKDSKYDEKYVRNLADLASVGNLFRKHIPTIVPGWNIRNADTGVIL